MELLERIRKSESAKGFLRKRFKNVNVRLKASELSMIVRSEIESGKMPGIDFKSLDQVVEWIVSSYAEVLKERGFTEWKLWEDNLLLMSFGLRDGRGLFSPEEWSVVRSELLREKGGLR